MPIFLGWNKRSASMDPSMDEAYYITEDDIIFDPEDEQENKPVGTFYIHTMNLWFILHIYARMTVAFLCLRLWKQVLQIKNPK